MLTLRETDESTLLGHIKDQNKVVPLFWHPKRDETLLIPPDFDKYMSSKKFRNKYRLTSAEVHEIIPALYEDEPISKAGLKSKFFKIRDDLETTAYTELRLSSNQFFTPKYFPEAFCVVTELLPLEKVGTLAMGIFKEFHVAKLFIGESSD